MLTASNGEVSGRGELVLAAGNHLCRNVYDLVALVVTTALMLPLHMVARLWRLPSGPITACAAVHASVRLFIIPDLPCLIISTYALWFRVLAFPNSFPSARPPCVQSFSLASCWVAPFIFQFWIYLACRTISPFIGKINADAQPHAREIIQIDPFVSSISQDDI